ncbi:MAG: hypothetical protein HXL03_00495 [Candidatus Nanosynbacter sp.]|nr:hypothetical protein [Candidatus Nanosynbacter sp.]
MQQIVLVIKAQTSGEVQDILDRIGINKDSSDKCEAISEQLFLVTIKRSKQIDPQIYVKINENLKIGILSDSSSRKRAEEVFKAVYEVEIQLRKLLLYLPDLIEAYYDILLQHGKYLDKCKSKDTENNLIFKKNLDTLVSYLTLGEIIEILGYDFSWYSHQLTANDLNELLNNSSSFDDFKAKFGEKCKAIIIWDVIAKEILQKDISWKDMKIKLNKLKEYRDAAAHHNHFIEKKKESAIKLAEEIKKDIKLPAKLSLSPEQQAQLQILNKQIVDSLKSVQNAYFNTEAIRQVVEYQQSLVSNVIKKFSTPSCLEILNKACPTIKNIDESLPKLTSYILSTQHSLQSSKIGLGDNKHINSKSIEKDTPNE